MSESDSQRAPKTKYKESHHMRFYAGETKQCGNTVFIREKFSEGLANNEVKPITEGGEERTLILLWIMAGYCASAVAFYAYITATARPEPQEDTAIVIDIDEWRNRKSEQTRRAA